MKQRSYDLAIVGTGIVGLAHALAAVRRGKKVVVIDRDSQANGASIRNFGFVTVTGQQAGDCWQKASRSRQVWAEVAKAARIPLLHKGLTMTARLPESEAVIDAFLKTEMGAECRRLTPAEAALKVPCLRQEKITCALYSPLEVRVESKDALPRIANWLKEAHAVDFLWQTSVNSVEAPKLQTSRGTVHAETVIVCPGDDGTTLFLTGSPLTKSHAANCRCCASPLAIVSTLAPQSCLTSALRDILAMPNSPSRAFESPAG